MIPRRLGALVGAILLLSGCALVRNLVASAFEPPTLTFESVAAQDLDLDGVTLVLHYRVANPNGIGLKVARLGYALDVEGHRLAAGDLPAGLQVPAKGTAPIALPVRFQFRELPGFLQLFVTRDALAYRVSGQVGVDTPIGVVDLPFDHADRVAVPRAPGFSLESAVVRQASLGELALELKVRVANPNPFPLPVGRLVAGLRIGGEAAGESAHVLAAVPPRASATVMIPVRLSLAGAGRAIAEALRSRVLEVGIRGEAGFEGLSLPLDLQARVPFAN